MEQENRTKTEVFGDTMLDLGKLTFGGIVLAGIFDASINKVVLVFAGLAFCALLVIIGIFLVTKQKK